MGASLVSIIYIYIYICVYILLLIKYCLQDQFDTIDLSDNEIRKVDGFPLLKRLKTLFLNNNRIVLVIYYYIIFITYIYKYNNNLFIEISYIYILNIIQITDTNGPLKKS